jgi:hypothetical protein
MIKEEGVNRRGFLSKSFKSIVSASAAIMATKVPAYEQYLGEDSIIMSRTSTIANIIKFTLKTTCLHIILIVF